MVSRDSGQNESGGLEYSVLKTWYIEKHNVAWLRYRGINIAGEPYEGRDLYCQCDFDDKVDGFNCGYKKEVRNEVKEESRNKYGKSWKKMGKKRAVLNIFKRVQGGEWLGQRYPSMIYVEEVADILERDFNEILEICWELFEEEKLDLTGYILTPYVSRFRFPKEIQTLFAYMVEEPLGWPNGDAGDGFVYALERVIHEHTNYKHGKNAFWEHNYPYISPHILLNFGMRWIQIALSRAQRDEDALRDLGRLYLRDVAEYLKQFAERCIELEQEAEALEGEKENKDEE